MRIFMALFLALAVVGFPGFGKAQSIDFEYAGFDWQAFADRQRVEKTTLAHALGKAERQGTTLRLFPSNAAPIEMNDLIKESDQSVFHTFQGLSRDRSYFVVKAQGYEDTGFLLVDIVTGEMIGLDSYPVQSRDGRLIACTGNYVHSAVPGIQVWRHVAGKFEEEWVYETFREFEDVKAIRWSAPHVLDLRVRRWDDPKWVRARAVRGRNGWTIRF